MGRIRTIKPEFFMHYELYQAEAETGLPLRIAFAGLWTQADREGRFKWVPPQLKLGCLPYDDIDFSRVLHALWTRGFIEKYQANGQFFGVIPGFKDHQVINNREKASSLPEPSKSNTLTREPRVDDASVTPLKHAQAEGKGREQDKHTEPYGSEPDGSDESSPDEKTPTVWDLWVSIAGEKSRSLLGKLIKQHGEESVAEAVAQVALKRPADPVSYLTGILRSKAPSLPPESECLDPDNPPPTPPGYVRDWNPNTERWFFSEVRGVTA